MAVPCICCCFWTFLIVAGAQQWYDGIEGVKVFGPGDTFDWWSFYSSMRHEQFNDTRYAILLKSGTYDTATQIGVGYYTSIIGVGASKSDVEIESFYALDLYSNGSDGGACDNFWRSVEGVTARTASVTWATSQACPIRRSSVQGELWLSETGPGTHWSSGGYLGDVEVHGALNSGTQQQFFFRNSNFQTSVNVDGVVNSVFVGSVAPGAPSTEEVAEIEETPRVAEKPFLVESNGVWHMAVPKMLSGVRGTASSADVDTIAWDDVFVAKAGDSAALINAGISGKRALLLTPGIYRLQESIAVRQSGFVVLGIGFPTLVPMAGLSALFVGAPDVRVASILLEAGTPRDAPVTEPMLQWNGTGGVLSDIFARVGSFPGRGCAVTRADVHVEVNGDGLVIDNSWLWHADHDDCDLKSDSCYDRHGLVVNADNVVVYGLKVEHVLGGNLVQWNGKNGRVFFFQSELPYHTPAFGTDGYNGYAVAEEATNHSAVGIGVYIVGTLSNVVAITAPSSASFKNLLGWTITGDSSQWRDLICRDGACSTGDCSGNKCRLQNVAPSPAPPAPSPSPSPSPSPAPAWQPCAGGVGDVCCNPSVSDPPEKCPDGETCQSCGSSSCQCPGSAWIV